MKYEEYIKLVEKRKKCQLCKGLHNPSNTECDSDNIGPWSLWQGNLNAEIVVVGQDWGDVVYFEKWNGRDQPSGNPTNENLQELLKIINLPVGRPQDKQNQITFFTNAILCLKTGGLQAKVEQEWFLNCIRYFLKPLIDIIDPKIIISLGKRTSESIITLYGIKFSKSENFTSIVEKAPYLLNDKTVLFPVYHCGIGSVNRNRSFSQQQADWAKIEMWRQKHRIIDLN